MLALVSVGQENRNFSGLKNKELRPCPGSNEDVRRDMNKELRGQGLPEWGAPPSNSPVQKVPRIDRLTVIDDQELEFRGEINFSGLTEGTIKVLFIDLEGQVQKEIKTPELRVAGSSGLLDIHSKLNVSGLQPNLLIRSGYIKLQYQPEGTEEGRTFCFVVPKNWKAIPRNETVTVELTALPIKTAAQLRNASESLPVPGGLSVGQNNTETNAELSDEESELSNDSIGNFPLGATNQAISLFGTVRSDVDFNNPADLSPILLSNIYFDKNPSSGVFYYLPSAYNLLWEKKSGYDFSTLYQKGSSDADGQVNMTATLSSGISTQENNIAKEWLAAHCKNNLNIKFTELSAILPQSPQVSLQGSLQSLYGMNSDQITVSNSSSIHDPIKASWSTDTDAANEILTALGQGVGISGDLSYKANSGEQSSYSVPINIGLANDYNFGNINLKNTSYRTTAFSNDFPFPIEANYLHIMILNEVNGKMIPCVYSYDLGGKTVLPRSKMKIDASRIPAWIDMDKRVKKIWIDYELISCNSCTEEVIDQISSGSSDDRVRSVRLNSMGMIRKYDVSFMKVVIRSRFFDPKGHMQLERSFIINKDNTEIEAGPFYVWNEKDLSYEYKIIMLNEEQTYEGNEWTASKDLELYINKGVLKNSLGNNLPGSN